MLVGEVCSIGHDVLKRSFDQLVQDSLGSFLIDIKLYQTLSQGINQLSPSQLDILPAVEFELLESLTVVEDVLEPFSEVQVRGEERMSDDRIYCSIANDLIDCIFIYFLEEYVDDPYDQLS